MQVLTSITLTFNNLINFILQQDQIKHDCTMETNNDHVIKIYDNKQDYNPEQYSPKRKKQKTKIPVKIQYINQNLEEAIEDVKNSMKNSTFKNDVKQLSKKYHSMKKLPIKQQQSNNSTTNQPPYFTSTFKKKYQQRLQEIKAKRMENQTKIVQSQIKAKLNRKIKENLQLKQRMHLVKEINQAKLQMERNRQNLQNQKKQQEQFLHACNEDRFKMLRKSKKKNTKQDLKNSKVQEQQSWRDFKFRAYINEKQKHEHLLLLKNRFEFISRSSSQGGFRSHRIKTSSISKRQIRTSQHARND